MLHLILMTVAPKLCQLLYQFYQSLSPLSWVRFLVGFWVHCWKKSGGRVRLAHCHEYWEQCSPPEVTGHSRMTQWLFWDSSFPQTLCDSVPIVAMKELWQVQTDGHRELYSNLTEAILTESSFLEYKNIFIVSLTQGLEAVQDFQHHYLSSSGISMWSLPVGILVRM